MNNRENREHLPQGRLKRLARLGGLATGLAGNLAGAAGRLATGQGWDKAAEGFHQQAAERLFLALGQMKGLPMKFGQMLSYIDDFIPAEFRAMYRQSLGRLQVKARPLAWEEIEAVIREDLGAEPDEIFASFDRDPIAAASIGQVYRATLGDGTEVAVKVQYPGVAEAIRGDLKNIKMLRDAFALFLPRVDVERTLADVASRVLDECDYVAEFLSQREFHEAWAGNERVIVPEVYERYSGHQVLVSRYIDAPGFDQMLRTATPQERSRYGETIFWFVFRSLYVFGLFHADPHPGNYLFLPDGRVALLDFGCVQRFDREALEGFSQVRRMAAAGVRGPELWQQMQEAYDIPEDFDEEEWEFLQQYILLSFEPVLLDRVFRYDRSYTEKVADWTLKGKMMAMRKVIRKGVREPKQAGLVFLNRIQYGLASVLASMEAEANWYRLAEAIDAEMAQSKAGA